jgi:hypothetical protein
MKAAGMQWPGFVHRAATRQRHHVVRTPPPHARLRIGDHGCHCRHRLGAALTTLTAIMQGRQRRRRQPGAKPLLNTRQRLTARHTNDGCLQGEGCPQRHKRRFDVFAQQLAQLCDALLLLLGGAVGGSDSHRRRCIAAEGAGQQHQLGWGAMVLRRT